VDFRYELGGPFVQLETGKPIAQIYREHGINPLLGFATTDLRI